MIELNKEYIYPQICSIVGWKQTTGNSKMAQLKEIENAYEFYHPENKKTHKLKKSYIFTKKIRDLVEPSRANNGGAHNVKSIQPMIDYLLGKLAPDDNKWYSFTDWYCEKLELLNKLYCNAVYHPDEIEMVCEREHISDDRLYCEYVSAAKSELKNMFLKSLNYLQKKEKVYFQDWYMFTYRLGKRSFGHVITEVLNDAIKENETIVCNDLNEEYHLSKKMSGRQLLRVIYSKEKLTKEFKEYTLKMIQDNEDAIRLLNDELPKQDDYIEMYWKPISSDNRLLSYYRGISIVDVTELVDNDTEAIAIEITNKVRAKVRRALYKSNIKIMKQSDLLAIERALFQHLDERFIDDYETDLSNDDMAELDGEFGQSEDFTVEEILDMSGMSEVQMNLP